MPPIIQKGPDHETGLPRNTVDGEPGRIRSTMTHASGQLDDVVAHRPDCRDDSPGDAAHEFSIPTSSSFVYGMRELSLLQDLDGESWVSFCERASQRGCDRASRRSWRRIPGRTRPTAVRASCPRVAARG